MPGKENLNLILKFPARSWLATLFLYFLVTTFVQTRNNVSGNRLAHCIDYCTNMVMGYRDPTKMADQSTIYDPCCGIAIENLCPLMAMVIVYVRNDCVRNRLAP